MSEPTHKLSAIPRCRKCGSDETYFYHRPGVQDGHSFEPMGEPVASPQATFGNTGTADYNGIGVKVTVPSEPSAAQPVAGTTPQAELLALRKKFKDEHMLNKHDSDRSEELIEIICEARAVAPVETPEVELCQICHRENPVWFAPNAVWNAVVTKISGILCPICFIKRAEQQGFRCTGWELVPELVNRPTDDKTPVGVGAPAHLAPVETPLGAEHITYEPCDWSHDNSSGTSFRISINGVYFTTVHEEKVAQKICSWGNVAEARAVAPVETPSDTSSKALEACRVGDELADLGHSAGRWNNRFVAAIASELLAAREKLAEFGIEWDGEKYAFNGKE